MQKLFFSTSRHTLPIDQQTSRANRTLGFLQWNLKSCPAKLKEQAYTSLERPNLECYVSVWDPHHSTKKLEGVQHKAARFVLNKSLNRTDRDSVTAMQQHMKWESLQERRQNIRIITLYKILHQCTI